MQSQSRIKDLKRKPGQGANLYNLSLGGLIIIGGLVWSLPGSTTGNLEIEQSAPAPVTPAAPPAPVKATAPVPVQSTPDSKPAAPRLPAPTIAPISSQPAQIRQGLQKNSYIDAAPQGTAAAPNLPTRTEVEFVPRSGQQAPLNTRYPAANRSANRAPVARQQSSPVNPPKAIAPRRQSINARNAAPGNNSVSPLNPLNIQPKISSLAIGQPVGANQIFSLDPMANRGIQIALAPLPEYSRATGLYSTQGQPGQGTDLMFPVAGVNPITSAFGWRIHPISGQGRMHNGTDIGAPMGTPVLAAYDGIVAAAQWSGGYGLMVTLRHLDGTQESRYAHLSEAFVESGQQVARGEVIGRVGSTGFSTGPHLHFEWRHLTNDGWVAVDAGPHLEAALANLMAAQKYAQSQADSQPQS
ncbi:M23 family metallopeptidase [Synechocystis sp. CACIAM 05]|jgi:murein DD-endopeptidase MepM/ murein hydrolase activator NlpD|uniref:M23 family metallopeptidase n=1 Tax=Synechocystis sp. CACIAM 05 TaxID=1933929 RepID=UPI00138E5F2F|nr:M23 family metallopeptidase [Synechocystis sp. CACIAM 05]QHU99282.1 peptidase M23 [Synechocystis sp. CACIAM 05]